MQLTRDACAKPVHGERVIFRTYRAGTMGQSQATELTLTLPSLSIQRITPNEL